MSEIFMWTMWWDSEVGDCFYNASNSAVGARGCTIRTRAVGGPGSGDMCFTLAFDDGRTVSADWNCAFGWYDDHINLVPESEWNKDRDEWEKAILRNKKLLAQQVIDHEAELTKDLQDAKTAHDEHFNKD